MTLQGTLGVRTEPVQQRSAERITTLLDAAAALIDEHGIDGLTTSDVAARSESSVGVIYRYYPNIQSLLRALAARNLERYVARVDATMSESHESVLDALNSAIDGYVELSRTEPGFRALRFGDVIDERFLAADESNNSLVARHFQQILTAQWNFPDSDLLEFKLEVVIEIAGALLGRAFRQDATGDERFITELRSLVGDFVNENGRLRAA